ncbi:hypothetical protein LOK49_LG01G01990 [Camellia lanceoleosa]|uniref:Uncharacterized protein n=1 Tax=Camellia lanceoleosa TaxID=1840588 RepID=A0ACC0ITS3_9ERIC|nr:hypothetical protein LOK49_LG01G01990 [Camellia lanceoleosa]
MLDCAWNFRFYAHLTVCWLAQVLYTPNLSFLLQVLFNLEIEH